MGTLFQGEASSVQPNRIAKKILMFSIRIKQFQLDFDFEVG